MNECEKACDNIKIRFKKSDGFAPINGNTSNNHGHCVCASLDLSDYESIRSFVSDVHQRFPNRPLSLLVNNAGIIRSGTGAPKNSFLLHAQTESKNCSLDHEVHIKVNHLGPFLLTRLLMPTMALNGRILFVGSEAHRQAAPFFSVAIETTQSIRNHLSSLFLPAWYKNYARSKLGNNLMTLYINDELERRKSSVRASCISPGRVQTAIFRDLNGPMGTIIKTLARFFFQTPSQGASGVLKIATDLSYKGRELDYVHCGRPSVPSPAARDRTIASEFWRWSMDATNLRAEDDTVLWPRR